MAVHGAALTAAQGAVPNLVPMHDETEWKAGALAIPLPVRLVLPPYSRAAAALHEGSLSMVKLDGIVPVAVSVTRR